jgi:hypothetical protein
MKPNGTKSCAKGIYYLQYTGLYEFSEVDQKNAGLIPGWAWLAAFSVYHTVKTCGRPPLTSSHGVGT